MTTYVEKTLATGEQVLLQTKISLMSFLWNFILGAAALFGFVSTVGIENRTAILFLVVAIVLVVHPFLTYWASELSLTNRRVVSKFGILSTRTTEIRLDKIESVSVKQSVMGRILGYGSIEVSGTGGSRDELSNIPDPLVFRTRFADALEQLGKN